MKNNLLFLVFFATIQFAMAQAPQSINYQAVARDASGKELPDNSKVSTRVSILDGNTSVYSEKHNGINTKLGLYNFLIGKGQSNDDFSKINWSSINTKSVKIETDIDNNGTYDLESTSQLVSVPYALFAEAANEKQTLKLSGNKLSILDANGKEINSVTLSGTNYVGGNGILVTDGVIINTKPDQIVTIIGTGGTTVTGTYPNFTVSSGAGSKQWSTINDEIRYTDGTNAPLTNKKIAFDNYLRIKDNNVTRAFIRADQTGAFMTLSDGNDDPRVLLRSDDKFGQVYTFGVNSPFGHKNCNMTALGGFDNNGYFGINSHPCSNGIYSVVALYKDKNGKGAVQVSNDECTGYFGAAMYFDDKNYTPGKWIVTAQVKSYKEDHPTDATKDVFNACIEGDEVAQYTRGTAKLIDGRVSISLPEIYSLMIEEGTMTVQITPNSEESLGLCVKNKTNRNFEVVELQKGKGNYTFDYEVKAIRKGYKNFKVIRDKEKMPSAAISKEISTEDFKK